VFARLRILRLQVRQLRQDLQDGTELLRMLEKTMTVSLILGALALAPVARIAWQGV
jgi:hypothetical protein